MSGQTQRRPILPRPVAWWRSELPFAMLFAAAAAAPFCVIEQGGDLRTAILSAFVVLGAPGAAVEGMVGLARLAVLWRDGT